jgi:hypothetical protein
MSETLKRALFAMSGQPGQKTPPGGPRDRRREWAKPAKGSGRRSGLEWPAEGSSFAAVRPRRDTGAALVLPYANAQAMNLHLEEIRCQATQGRRAV